MLSPRKKRGVGLLVSGLAFIAAGVVVGWVPDASNLLTTAFGVVGAVANVLGFNTVFPDLGDDPKK